MPQEDLKPPIPLPVEIFTQGIFPYLDLRSFLDLTSTCKYYQKFAFDDIFFEQLAYRVFNLPPQHVRTEGWRKVFEKIYTARVFTWGEVRNGRLGHSWPLRPGEPNSDGVPKQIDNYKDMNGTVIDIQAGGWCTSFLTSTGDVYAVGIPLPQYYPGSNRPIFNHLKFPSTEETPKIVHISSGRSHILGLDDEGKVWLWKANFAVTPAVQCDFLGGDHFLDLLDHMAWSDHLQVVGRAAAAQGKVICVKAGWTTSSAYVTGIGIVFGDLDSADTNNHLRVVAGTSSRSLTSIKHGKTLDEKIGLVKEYVVCENFLVFLTEEGQVYAYPLSEEATTQVPVHLAEFSAPGGTKVSKMIHISGSFRNFAVFNTDGVVYLGNHEMIAQALKSPCLDLGTPRVSNVKPTIMPDLQNRGIIKIAFGDYHRLALTANGKVLAWGTEPQACGAFGIGAHGDAAARGAIMEDDLVLRKPVEVYFHSTSEYHPEQESKYFAFNIAAAGWHSGALISCPSEAVKKEKEKESPTDSVPDPAKLVEKPGIGPKNPAGGTDPNAPSVPSRHLPSGSSSSMAPPPPMPGAVPQLPQETGNPFMINPNVYPLAHPLASNNAAFSASHWQTQQQTQQSEDDEETLPTATSN